MCEPKSGGGKVLVGTAVAAGIALAAASAQSTTATAAAAPAAATAPAAAGFPWLTASLGVLAGAATLGLILLAVRALRRRRATVRVVPPVMRRRVPQRAIEAPQQPAREWLNGKTGAR